MRDMNLDRRTALKTMAALPFGGLAVPKNDPPDGSDGIDSILQARKPPKDILLVWDTRSRPGVGKTTWCYHQLGVDSS